MMKDDDFKLLMGFADRLTDRQMDICDCRVAFATENVHERSDQPFFLSVRLVPSKLFIQAVKSNMLKMSIKNRKHKAEKD